MASRNRFPQRSRGSAKRRTTWVGPADQGYIDVAAGAKVIIGTFDAVAQGLNKPTVVRTRGEVSITPAAGIITDIEIVGAYGLALVSDQAVAAGVASVPGPFADADWDGWFVWRSFHYTQEAAGTVASLMLQSVQQEVDSKAMRIVSENETIVLVAESQAQAFRISMPLRLLMKLA